MVSTTTYSSGELLSSFVRPVPSAGMLQPLPPHLVMPPAMADAQQKRSPLLCGYPSKKCWSWRVEKRNGELHKFCEYHRQKANTNQRRMEQRRKQGRAASPRAKSSRRSHKVNSADAKQVVKLERPSTAVPKAISQPKAVVVPQPTASTSGSPRGIDAFSVGSSAGTVDDAAIFSWMDAELDIGIGMDAAVDYMMVDTPVIDMEPSDTPVDLFEEDLFFLEHFIDEISHSTV